MTLTSESCSPLGGKHRMVHTFRAALESVGNAKSGKLIHIKDAIHPSLTSIENGGRSGISSGLENLDEITGGFQLNRQAEMRPTKDRQRRPPLSNLRNSGGIEEAADLIIGLCRPDVYLDGEAFSGNGR